MFPPKPGKEAFESAEHIDPELRVVVQLGAVRVMNIVDPPHGTYPPARNFTTSGIRHKLIFSFRAFDPAF